MSPFEPKAMAESTNGCYRGAPEACELIEELCPQASAPSFCPISWSQNSDVVLDTFLLISGR